MTASAAARSPNAAHHDTRNGRYSDAFMNRMRQTGDPLADQVAAQLKRHLPSQMLDEVMARADSEGGVFRDFLDYSWTVPDWVDWDLIERARRVQLAFGQTRGVVLLVGGLAEGAGLNKASEVLAATGRFKPEKVIKRLYETGQMTHNSQAPNGLRPGGPGHRTIMEVRLLHAMVRRHLLSKGWDSDRFDHPINQEDMLFTIIEFNHLAVRGMARLGATLSREDRKATHHFWRYVAYLNGVTDEFLTTSPEDEALAYDRIMEREHEVHPITVERVHELITGTAGQPPMYLPAGMMFELCATCLGEERARQYQLPRSRAWRAVIKLLTMNNRIQTRLHYLVPGLGRAFGAWNFRMAQRMLTANIEAEVEKRAFRHIA